MTVRACGLALLVLGVTTGRSGSALADQNEALAGDLSHAFTPAQMSHLIIAANASSLTDQEAQSVGRLKSLLDVNDNVALALLRILNRPEILPEDTPQILAQSAAQYRAVIDRLGEIAPEDAESRRMVTEAQTALRAGKFNDTETLLRKLEDREVASTVDPPGGGAQAGSSATQHLISAAQAGTVLGEIALMKLHYGDATKYFQSAQQRLAALSQADTAVAVTQPDDTVADRSGVPPAAETEPKVARIDLNPPPAQPRPEVAAIVAGAAAVTPVAAPAPAAPRRVPERATSVASDGTGVSAEMLVLLLQRGDALLALGDVASARLLYERAAAAGDGRGATGAGKTYDPKVLLAIGARGIQGDPVTAASWYRRAIELGDRSAAERLAQISQRGER